MNSKILFVDDDAYMLASFTRNLRKQFVFDTAVGGAQGLERIRADGPYALLVADMHMPGMNGIEFLEQAAKIAPDAVQMMLTGSVDQQTEVKTLDHDRLFRLLNKPCPRETLVAALQDGLKHFETRQGGGEEGLKG